MNNKQWMKAIILFGLCLVTLSISQPTMANENSTDSSLIETKGSEEKPSLKDEESTVDTSEEINLNKQDTELNSAEKENLEKEVIESIAKTTNQTNEENVGIDPANYTAEELRNHLLSIELGDKEVINKYTDEQLLESFPIFMRYNYDYTGMDFSGYYRLLNSLYVDKILDIKAVLSQMAAFNPSDAANFTELKGQLPALQTYLGILYPANSTFFPIPKLTDQVLTDILDYLITLETNGIDIPIGTIGMIDSRQRNLSAENKEKEETKTESSSSNTETTNSSQAKEKVKEDTKKPKGSILPQTGAEKTNWIMAIVGTITLIIVGGIFYKKRLHSK